MTQYVVALPGFVASAAAWQLTIQVVDKSMDKGRFFGNLS
jgi:hypothetical protein